ncbi:MAG: histidine kinase [Desulfobacteraceae bacterium]|nr:histidine kinase [Desulfobacteraceae bacterium]MCF8036167.1 histidine kinase [Desulfobacteraceae bacterium]
MEHPNAHQKEENNRKEDSADFRQYFRKLRKRLFVSICLAFLVPLVILSVYFHIQFNTNLKKSSRLHLISLAESQRNTVDLFLQERVANLFSLFHRAEFNVTPTQDRMNSYLQHLTEFSDAYVDVGFMTPRGVQIGYSGPYPYLRGKDYSEETWYVNLMKAERNYFISDIYMGFRNKPHFTIAVKQPVGGGTYVMRATLDPDKIYMFLRNIAQGKSVASSLINMAGTYQIVDPDEGGVLSQSPYDPKRLINQQVLEISMEGKSHLIAAARLTEVPWVLIVHQPLNVAYAKMYTTRRIMIGATILIVLVMFSAIWMATYRLLRRAEENEASRRELKSQLFHAAKLASLGELSAGVAHEINNPLGVILSQCGVIKDIFDPEYGGSTEIGPETAGQVREEIGIIEESVYRARDVTQKLLKSSRRTEPRLVQSNVNDLIDEVVEGFMERELKVSNIELIRDYDRNLPDIRTDPDQTRQVFQNLINNAFDAIEGPGKITISTRHSGKAVKVAVSDTGKGMTSEEMEKIFLPFFTTKEVGKGTGLGLAISLNIVESLGGSMHVQSMPGAGSAFTITFPIDLEEQATAEASTPGNDKRKKEKT